MDAVSFSASGAYVRITQFALFILTAFLVFYTLYIVMAKMAKSDEDPFYLKSMKPVLINSAVIVALLGMGLFVPKAVSTITLEPVAYLTHGIASSVLPAPDHSLVMVGLTKAIQVIDPAGPGIYSPELKHRIIDIMRMTASSFQNLILFGFNMLSNSLSLDSLVAVITLDFGKMLETIFMFLLGLVITWQFIKIYFKFLFYFVDVIVSLALFAFLFPVMLAAFVMQNSEAPDWVKKMGGMSGTIFQNAVKSIITLASAMIVYVVIVAMIGAFLGGVGASEILAGDFSNVNFAAPEIMRSATGIAVLVLVLKFLIAKVDPIANEIKSAIGFADSAEGGAGMEAYKSFAQLAQNIKGKYDMFRKFQKGGK
jgi:hypothetical protein